MAAAPARPRIVIVDDDEVILDLLLSRLLALGRYEVTAVHRAREIVTRLGELRPDLIVSDIDMPGMDGGALAAALRETEAGKRVPIVFLSSMISVAESDAGHGQVGGWPMLSKKTPFEKVLAAIEKGLADATEGPQG